MEHSAPKARDVKAWANGPGYVEFWFKALKARNTYWSATEGGFMSRLQRVGIWQQLTWGVAQAVALRTFGAN